MASTPQAFWQTLLAAASELGDVLVGTFDLMSSTYMDVKPVATTVGETINIPIPANVNSLVESNPAGDPLLSDYTVNTVPIVLNQHLRYSTKIGNFDTFNSPVTIKDTLLMPGIKGVATKANAYIASLVTTGNFNVYSAVATTASQVTPDQFVTSGFQTLLTAGVDVRNPMIMSFIQNTPIYAKQLRNADWSQESLVGINVAEQAKVEGGIKVAYGAVQKVDQQLPVSGSSGSFTYTSVYMSKYAIAAAVRPIPPGDPRVVFTTYIDWHGWPIRIEFGYNNAKQAWLLVIDCGFGASVVRPDQGIIFSTAQ